MLRMLGLDETVDQLAMTNSICRNGHVPRRQDGHVLKRELMIKAKDQKKKGKPKRHG